MHVNYPHTLTHNTFTFLAIRGCGSIEDISWEKGEKNREENERKDVGVEKVNMPQGASWEQ